jgi:hypothetical protein
MVGLGRDPNRRAPAAKVSSLRTDFRDSQSSLQRWSHIVFGFDGLRPSSLRPGAELYRLIRVKKNLLLLVSLTRVVHQVRVKKVHQVDINLSSKGCKLGHASGKCFLQLRPVSGGLYSGARDGRR